MPSNVSLAAGVIYVDAGALANLERTLLALRIARVLGVPAVRPAHYASRAAMVRDLFGGDGTQQLHGMSELEIALALSHRKALRRLAHERARWVAVFEEDAALHPRLTPERATSLLHSSLRGSRFVYLGACRPSCPSTPGCYAYCTHAYAMEHAWAATFFYDVYCSGAAHDAAQTSPCGAHCRTQLCQTDQQFVRYFRRVPNATVAAIWYASPDVPGHRGLFYQPRNRTHSGTNLGDVRSHTGVRDVRGQRS